MPLKTEDDCPAEDEDDDSEDDEKYAMLRADLDDKYEGGYERRNDKKEVIKLIHFFNYLYK